MYRDRPSAEIASTIPAAKDLIRPLVLIGVTAALIASPASAGPPSRFVVPRGEHQLFLDDVGIESIEQVHRVLHPPKRHPGNPVLRPDTAWEDRCQVYGTALYDSTAKLFRMWYLTSPRDRGLRPLKLPTHERAPHTTLAAYAQSRDGIHWEKPSLGLFPYDGDAANNLLGLGRYNCEGISVLHDKIDPDPARRYKAVYWDHGSGDWEIRDGRPFAKPGDEDGFCVAFSADGIRWKPYEGNPVLKVYCDTNQNVVYDPRIERYVAFSRFGMGRRLARSESEDFLSWSEPRLVLECDAADGPATQIYGAGVDLYEGIYLAMIWIYREGGDGKIDTQLATSRNGIDWTRVADRATWLELGDDESWEGGMVRSVERIIPRGDELYIYYCGVHGPHTSAKIKNVERKHRTAIGLVTLPRDRFVSLEAGRQGGKALTHAFALPEGRLHVNFRAAENGQLRIVLYDVRTAEPAILARSRPLTGDHLSSGVSWEPPVPETPPGAQVKLRFEPVDAEIFSYWWE